MWNLLLVVTIGLVAGGGGTALALRSLRRRRGKDHANALLKNFAVLGATLVLCLALGELVVRFVFRDITTTGNPSYFETRWIKAEVHLNSWGFREREFAALKPHDVYRIAVIGDSLTYGQGIPKENRFTELLEESLNGRKQVKRRYEVLNFGRGGDDTVEEVDTLQNVVFKTNPDFILLQWFTNDFRGRDKSSRRKVAPFFQPVHAIFRTSSALYYLIGQQWLTLSEALGRTVDEVEVMRRLSGDPDSPDSREAGEALRTFIELCKSQGKPVGIVLFPWLALVGGVYPFDYLHNRVLTICAQQDITCVDLRSTFAPYLDGKKLQVNRFDGHPNALANRLAAERIIDTFGQLWLSGALDGGSL